MPPLPEGLSRIAIVGPGTATRRSAERLLLKLKGEVECFETMQAMSSAPDLVVLMEEAGDRNPDGVSCPVLLCRVARGGGETPLPLITLDRSLNDLRSDIVAHAGAAPVAQVADAPPPQKPATPRRLRLLAAEDNKTNQMIFRKMIKALDLDLTMAGNGAEALAAYRAERPDILFTDISMPEMDGLALTREIRRLEAEGGLPPLPIIAMTAHAMDDHEAEIRGRRRSLPDQAPEEGSDHRADRGGGAGRCAPGDAGLRATGASLASASAGLMNPVSISRRLRIGPWA